MLAKVVESVKAFVPSAECPLEFWWMKAVDLRKLVSLAPARNCDGKPWLAGDREGFHPRYRGNSCRCRWCSPEFFHRDSPSASVPAPARTTSHLYESQLSPDTYHAAGSCFEKKLGTLGDVDAVVKISSTRGLGLFHAGSAAAQISDARSPDFLRADRRKQRHAISLQFCTASCCRIQIGFQVLPNC